MATSQHHFAEITCPDTGRQIVVARSLRDDPVGHLYASNQISPHQRAAIDAYQRDIEALEGRLRSPSRGPQDAAWRGRRSDGDRQRDHHARLERAHRLLGPDRTRLLRDVINGSAPSGAAVREFLQALDQLAVAYGLATATRH